MSSYTNKLKMVFDGLTFSEEKLSNYIQEHREEIRNLTSQELADAVGVGQSTVIRFSQKLGYGNYKKMIADISMDNPDAYVDLEIDDQESTVETMEKLREQYNLILDMTFDMNKSDDVDLAVDFLYNARKIIIAGFSVRNNCFADYFAHRLSYIGLDAYHHDHTTMIYSALNQCNDQDVIIVLSESGETRDMVNFAKLAKKRGMKVISITKVSENTIKALSDINFKLVEYGNRTFLRTNLIRSSLLAVFDMIYLNLLKKDFERFEMHSTMMKTQTKLNYKA